MRILEVTFSNLNSLTGKHRIDFADPRLAGRGIFLVCGPIGAGKTTIFDAIHLALYGRTPRLDSITDNGNDIMSKGASDCMAEVKFSVRGATYRAYFAQQRARKGSQKELKKAERKILDAEGGIVAEGIKDCNARIAELTELDAEQFMQTVMLPQGGFADFLKAAPQARGAILEKLTHAEEYARIAAKVHEKFTAGKSGLEKGEAARAAIAGEMPGDDAVAAMRGEAAAAGRRETELETAIAAGERNLATAREAARLHGEQAANAAARTDLQNESARFAPDRKRLDDHRRALQAVAEATDADNLQRQCTAVGNDLAEKKRRLPDARTAVDRAAADMQSAAAAVRTAKEAEAAADPALAEAKALEARKHEWEGQRKQQAESWKSSVQACKKAQDAVREADEECAALKRETTRFTAALPAGVAPADVDPDRLRGQAEQLRDKLDQVRKAAQALDAHHQAAGRLAQAETEKTAAAADATETARTLEETDRRLTDGQRHLQTARDSVANANLAKKYLDDRQKLTDGRPCPLCGAVHHPAAGQDDQAVRDTVRRAGDTLKKQEEECRKLQKERDALLRQNSAAQTRLDGLREKVTDLRQEREQAWTAAVAALTAAVFPTAGLVPEDTERLQAEAAAREEDLERKRAETAAREQTARKWRKLTDALQAATAKAEERRNFLADREKEKEKIRAAGTQAGQELEAVKKELARVLAPWNAATAQEVATRLRAACDEARQRQAAAEAARTGAERELAGLQTQVTELETRLADLQARSADAGRRFGEALTRLGFADAGEFARARLNNADAAALDAREKKLDGRKQVLESQKLEIEKKLAQLPPLPKDDAAALETRLTAAKTEQRQTHDRLVTLQSQLKRYDAQAEKLREFAKELQVLQAEHDRWKKLDDLIGGGVNHFGRIAQQFTVGRLVTLANRHLRNITDRYELRTNSNISKDLDGLELRIFDHCHGGVERPVNNLSGGENFLVSLALALGMAELAGGKGQVNSLFLDEGFGTLDTETLDTAINALATLHDHGRVIGVISHVRELRERLPDHIEVRPVGDGRSQVFVNGVSAAVS